MRMNITHISKRLNQEPGVIEQALTRYGMRSDAAGNYCLSEAKEAVFALQDELQWKAIKETRGACITRTTPGFSRR